jgi:hypothetical protein
MKELLERAIRELPETYRSVVRDMEELSAAQIDIAVAPLSPRCD